MRFAVWTFSIGLSLALPVGGRLIALAAPVAEKGGSPAGSGQSLISDFLEQVVRDQLKDEYVDDDDWGKTRRVTVGYQVKGKPFEWDLKSRKKQVNDGLWEKYKVRLVNPEEHLHVSVSKLEMQDGRLTFGISLVAKLDGDARLERWRQGIKMLNAHVEAVGTVEIHLEGAIGIKLTTGDALPAIAIEPAITDLDIKLLKFDLKRISKLDGPAAHELGDGLKDKIQRELNRREPKIVAKLNKSIEKRKDKLRLSPQDFARTGWSKLQESLK